MATFTTHNGVELAYEDRGGSGSRSACCAAGVRPRQCSGASSRTWPPAAGLSPLTFAVMTGRASLVSATHRPLLPDVYELIDYLGLERADVLGWSMGVSVWWSFIDQYGTDRIRRFMAVDQPSAVAAVPWMTAEHKAESGAIFDVAALLALGEGLNGASGTEVRDGFVRSMFSGDTDPDVLSFVMAELDTVPPYVGVPLLFDHCAQDWRDVLPRIDVPTLVIGCDGSHVDPSSQRYIAGQIPGASLCVFPTDVASSTSRSSKIRLHSTR